MVPSNSKVHIFQGIILLKHLKILEQVDLPRIYSGPQNSINSHITRWEFMFLKYTDFYKSLKKIKHKFFMSLRPCSSGIIGKYIIPF